MKRTTKAAPVIKIYRCKKCKHVGFWSLEINRFICNNFVRCDSEEYTIERR